MTYICFIIIIIIISITSQSRGCYMVHPFFSFQRNSECFLAVKEWDNKLQLSDNEK